MEMNCTGCGKALHDGDWRSKSGLCRACAEAKHDGKKGSWLKSHWWIIVVVASVLYVAAFIMAPRPQPRTVFDESGKLTKYGELQAVSIVEDAIKDILKAPDTADFDHSEDRYIVESDNKVSYYGIVTAQNALGVPLRSGYIVEFVIWGLDYDENEIVSADLVDE